MGNRTEIGTLLRKLRKEKGVSQGELSERSGVNRSYLSMVENNHSSPTLEVLEKLAAGLNISLWLLMSSLEERHWTYDSDDMTEMYPGLRDFLDDEDEMLLVQPTQEEINILRSIRLKEASFIPDKRFFRDVLLAYRRSRK